MMIGCMIAEEDNKDDKECCVWKNTLKYLLIGKNALLIFRLRLK